MSKEQSDSYVTYIDRQHDATRNDSVAVQPPATSDLSSVAASHIRHEQHERFAQACNEEWGRDQRSSVRFSEVDRHALSLIENPEAIACAVETATALVGPNRTSARLELIATKIAIENARLVARQAFQDGRIMAKDWKDVKELEHLIDNTTKRLCALAREYAAACHVVEQRSIVLVEHADNINFGPKDK